MQLQTFAAQDANGNVQTSPTVYIYTLGTQNPISGLEDENGDPLSNPFTGGSDGRIVVAAPTGVYDMRVVKGSFDSTQVVQFIDLDTQVAAAELAENNAQSSATAAAASAAAAAEIVNISEVQTFTNPLQLSSRVAMTGASSGSRGWLVQDNPEVNFGTGDFTLHWEGSLPDWTPSSNQFLVHKYLGAPTYLGYRLYVHTTGAIAFAYGDSTTGLIEILSTAVSGVSDGSCAKVTASVVRETASSAGSVSFYVNGVQLGTSVAISAATPPTVTNTEPLYINGTSSRREAGNITFVPTYNRALSATEVLSLCKYGVDPADVGASQVPVYESDFSAGVDGWVAGGSNTVTGNVDSINGSDDWLKVERISSTGGLSANVAITGRGLTRTTAITLFNPIGSPITHIRIGASVDLVSLSPATIAVPAGTEVSTTITYVNNKNNATLQLLSVNSSGAVATVAAGTVIYAKAITVRDVGITGQWNAQDAQSDTGQIFDSSGNKNHALLPAAGATIIGRPTSQPQQVRWTNTWAGTNELQYIGGTNQAIVPANAYIESIVGTVSGATPHDIVIGDGSDTDRYVTITTGLAAGTTTFTLANRTTDGTNLKLTVDPDTDCTMSIAWTITYRLLETV